VITVVRSQETPPSSPALGTFTGEAWKDTILSRRDGINMGSVFFAPGSRTHWHTHQGGQILIVTAGEGYVGDATSAVKVTVGDTIWTPPGVTHWHGASPNRYLVHTAISIAAVEWHEALSEAEYAAFTG
jgi:quercetin dioxygenase-like cupin family protein